jgi:NADPH:quinone reductase-like Zn-dependent oxidoreductase
MRSLVIEQVGDSAAVLQVADIDDPASTDGHALLKVTARPYLLLRPIRSLSTSRLLD